VEPAHCVSSSDHASRLGGCVHTTDATPGQGKERRPRLALTFDDGWKDNFKPALPISRKYGIPFTVFFSPQMMPRRESFWTSQAGSLWAAAQRTGKLDVISTFYGAQARRTADSP